MFDSESRTCPNSFYTIDRFYIRRLGFYIATKNISEALRDEGILHGAVVVDRVGDRGLLLNAYIRDLRLRLWCLGCTLLEICFFTTPILRRFFMEPS